MGSLRDVRCLITDGMTDMNSSEVTWRYLNFECDPIKLRGCRPPFGFTDRHEKFVKTLISLTNRLSGAGGDDQKPQPI